MPVPMPSMIRPYRDKETGTLVEAVQLQSVDQCHQTVSWIESRKGRGAAIVSLSHDASLPEPQRVNGVLIGSGGVVRKASLWKENYVVRYPNDEFYGVAPARFEEQYEIVED